jgi:epoxyqueuosine reductase
VILTTLDFAPSVAAPQMAPPDLCGNCRLCLDACPTGALAEPYVMEARLCISYLTIEQRGAIPESLRAAVGEMVFGCDICQDVCPWNRQARTSPLNDFAPRTTAGHSLVAPPLAWLASLSEVEYRAAFSHSAVKRAKWRGLLRNVCVALGNAPRKALAGFPRAREALSRLAESPDELVAEHARWALARWSAAPRKE